MNILQFLISGTPFYPHWLEFLNLKKGDEQMYKYFKGKVLEVGCGNGERKAHVLATRGKKIISYLATDHSSWDEIFENFNKRTSMLGIVSRYLFGKSKSATSIDDVCDALHIKYKSSSFDTYCAYEVLEHISDPDQFFKEASRVLKKGGYCVLSVPYMYREHSEGTGFDYFRYTKSCLTLLGKKYNLQKVSIMTQSYFGTTIAAATNQYVIRKIMEGPILIKLILFPFSPFIFFLTNVTGYILDLVDHDERYATRFHAVYRKI